MTVQSDEAVEVGTLANGMRVALEPLPHLRSASAGAWIKTGSANETSDLGGISHLLEHLFFKGTKTRTTRQLMEAIESRGGHLNAFTSREYTCVYVRMLDTHIAAGIEILADIVKHSQFLDLEKERRVILEEIASIEDVPEDYAHDLLAGHLWPQHPLGRPVTGTLESVSRLTLEDIRAYYDAWYVPENMVFSVAGSFDPKAVGDQVAEEFGGLPTLPLQERSGRPEIGAGVKVVKKNLGQEHVCMGFPGSAVTDGRRYAYEMLSCVLGGGATSRLFEKIREEAGLAYSIYSFSSYYVTAGLFGVYAAVAPENLETVLDRAFAELRLLRDVRISEEELAINREQLKGNLLIALEDTSNRMSRMAKSLLYHGRVIGIDEITQAVDAVTVEEVQRLAQELFRAERCALVVLGPTENGVLETVPL